MSSPAELDRRFAAAHARLRTAAVTGTNGKTTTTSMIAAIVAAAGEVAARLTTLGAWVGDRQIEAASPPEEFLATVEAAVAAGVRTLALETTSKALAGGHARHWPPTVAVFTNLTRDHLDYHGSPEAYLAAKAQLFLHLVPDGTAVLNADDPSADLIEAAMGARTQPAVVRRYSVGAATGELALAARAVHPTLDGTVVELAPSPLGTALGGELRLRAVGEVHAANALGAALAADALGYPAAAIVAGLAGFTGVAGRFEVVARRPDVVVDYAHTPDGLDGTLRTARRLVRPGGRVVCVFGCGGGRDRGKRPQMGAIADELADVVVLTSDNPRHEAPDAIAAAVSAGVPSPRARWTVELDRGRAIARAIAEAGPDDLVIVAGKGHERVQEVAGRELPFDDVEVSRRAAAARR
ncbi:MAG: UDP-N-acetylmuramyl-tripeptide synthetase [Kofleriaceae bacterium]